jgi:hypothetical protein
MAIGNEAGHRSDHLQVLAGQRQVRRVGQVATAARTHHLRRKRWVCVDFIPKRLSPPDLVTKETVPTTMWRRSRHIVVGNSR